MNSVWSNSHAESPPKVAATYTNNCEEGERVHVSIWEFEALLWDVVDLDSNLKVGLLFGPANTYLYKVEELQQERPIIK